ncbi:choline ethanolamine kinase [Blastocystis sp. subtype 4]|uniref:choline ethanolamine kinase n=1 Tax=Blastocystis sp. subtype 4 TaxID=944170 RepID=UPI000711426C|nr:choline ethanolamine kinase [Blastocystis sp. subtype 4]KNB42241.1 choline ethanolamine kinase [Blastocystis sp. subtype 4]|eukprot:XP_014525684.1 choline ethanolamine kinase [Blastocystis sp. subtype 4]
MYYIDTGHTDMRQLAFDIVKGLDRPGWKDVSSVDEIEISRASGAMTNIIYKVTVKGKECQPLLLRAYGNCTDTFLDRETEVRNFKILSDNSFGIELLKTFPGGRLELWRDGYDPITAPQMRTKWMYQKVARKMAEMHSISVYEEE